MNLKEIKELIETLTEKDIAEFELEQGNEKIRIRRNVPNAAPQIAFTPVTSIPSAVAVQPQGVAAPAAPPGPESPAAPAQEELHIVKSPIVGTFYESPAPGAAIFVQVGEAVEPGQVLCIIEAMKLMNEIECDVAGIVEKRFVSNQQPVEYGEALFGIRKR